MLVNWYQECRRLLNLLEIDGGNLGRAQVLQSLNIGVLQRSGYSKTKKVVGNQTVGQSYFIRGRRERRAGHHDLSRGGSHGQPDHDPAGTPGDHRR